MTLFTVGIHHEGGRGPLHAKPFADGLPQVRVFADVNADGDEVVVDESGHFRIRIHLGIQPSAAGSHRGGAEVEQNVPRLPFHIS
jgi:hypothetical protein